MARRKIATKITKEKPKQLRVLRALRGLTFVLFVAKLRGLRGCGLRFVADSSRLGERNREQHGALSAKRGIRRVEGLVGRVRTRTLAASIDRDCRNVQAHWNIRVGRSRIEPDRQSKSFAHRNGGLDDWRRGWGPARRPLADELRLHGEPSLVGPALVFLGERLINCLVEPGIE